MMEIRAEKMICAYPIRVMRALTDSGELSKWGCEQAEVSGDSYRLTGPAIPYGALGGRLLERSAAGLQFEWVLQGTATIVSITLETVPQSGNPPADFTRVIIRHTGVPESSFPGGHHQAECWEAAWVLWLRNLKGWVERAEVPGGFDYTASCPPVVERKLTMDAPADRVWRAIVDPELRARWYQEQLGPETRREEGRMVAFGWPMEPVPTEVEFHLEPLSGGDRTLVLLRHAGLPQATVDYHLGWHDYLVALQQETARPIIRQTTWIKAPADRVWRYFTTQEGLRQWFAGSIEFDGPVQPGSTWKLFAHGGWLTGEVVTVDPAKRLVLTWIDCDLPEREELLLTLDLIPEAGGTRVLLTKTGFEKLPMNEYLSYQRGWSEGSTVARLKEIVEGEEQVA